MSNARAQAYNVDLLPRPIELFDTALKETANERAKIEVKDAVVHWFKWDLRTCDNKALHLASQKAKEKGVPLICMYIVSPQDLRHASLRRYGSTLLCGLWKCSRRIWIS
jgi:deoxyribodipyrimidine photo-lyase